MVDYENVLLEIGLFSEKGDYSIKNIEEAVR